MQQPCALGGTGGRVWSSAVMLLEYLVDSGAARGRHVVELGCGTGVVGIACAEVPAVGAASVVLTDMDDDSLDLARANVMMRERRRGIIRVRKARRGGMRGEVGGLATAADAADDDDDSEWVGAGPIDVCKFDWADPAACLVEQLRASKSAQDFTSRRGVLVVGSDLCYTPAAIELLIKAVAGLLRHPEWGGPDAKFISVCGLRKRTLLPCLLAAVARNGLEVVEEEPVVVFPSDGAAAPSCAAAMSAVYPVLSAASVAARHAWDGDNIAGTGGWVRFTLVRST
jgi:predicted nicotinamide N-methyase